MIHRYIFIFLFLFASISFGQFESNKHIVGPSLGFSFLGSTFQVGIDHEYGLNLKDLGIGGAGKIGIGGVFRYWAYSEETSIIERDYTNILVGFQSNYHFYMPNDRVDPWIGFIAGYNFGSEDILLKIQEYSNDDDSHGGFWLGAQAGSRYWINKNFALSLRIGFGIQSYGFLDFGIDYKIN